MKKVILLLILSIFLSGCATERSSFLDRGNYEVDTSHTALSQNYRIRFLILHYTATDDANSLDILTKGDVSAHYLVLLHPRSRNGKPVVLSLVPEDKRAWHAGYSYWNGRNNLNDTSIGIEVVNLGYKDGSSRKIWFSYKPDQISLIALVVKDIVGRYGITPDSILAHSDIAPLRKSDPGPLFPWEALAKQGIGAWPDHSTVVKLLRGRSPKQISSVLSVQRALAHYGYDIPQTGFLDEATRKVISAFQMHFRANDFSGYPDAETEAIAWALVKKYRS